MSERIANHSLKIPETRGLVLVGVFLFASFTTLFDGFTLGPMFRSAFWSIGAVLVVQAVLRKWDCWRTRHEVGIFQNLLNSVNGTHFITNKYGVIVAAKGGDEDTILGNTNIVSLLTELDEVTAQNLMRNCEGLAEGCRTIGATTVSVNWVSSGFYMWTFKPLQAAFTDFPQVLVTEKTILNKSAQKLFGDEGVSYDFQNLKIGRSNRVLGNGELEFTPFKYSQDDRDEYVFLPQNFVGEDFGGSDFEVLPVPMIKLTVEGRLINANADACKLLGIKNGDGLTMQDLMEGLGRSISDWLTDASHGRGLSHPEFLRLTRRDKEVFVQVSLNKSTDAGRTVLIAVLNDATELKTLEAQFVQSQKMQAIGQLAGGVAHDFNNLLTAISGHCDLLLLRHDASDQDYADLVQINQNANRAAALVSQLLAFSRKQTLRPESLDMRETLADLTHLLNRLVGEKINLSLNYDPELRAVRADKRQLEQVIMNLVVNARDAMPEGGCITISTEGETILEPTERDRVSIEPGDYVSIKVSDQGCGIPVDKVQKIFEPFYTTKRTGEGTGLGLSTVYGIVKQTGGYIFVDSKLEQGTEFTLLLPVAEIANEPAIEVPVAAPIKRRSNEKGIVLLVEDEAPVRTFASRALQLRGYQVIEAACAEEALLKLEDDELKIDVFVTDVVMPGRDGPSWVKEALIKRPDVRVVFVSGYAEDSFETHQAEIKNSVFLPKPFSLNDLTDTVQRQLH